VRSREIWVQLGAMRARAAQRQIAIERKPPTCTAPAQLFEFNLRRVSLAPDGQNGCGVFAPQCRPVKLGRRRERGERAR
jgi:hypothetical protein